ncbi:SGNH hydrolase [Hortaea werneckii]|uniref:SGNH hydrolase-type esterase domain-containing protein n=1 Tax=Hortaea werneckii TaxID=91943 RepID=A0A3M7F7D1_HORWE|nr:SGNH hydrolase [Hortaea werneckii]RMY84712.1 hypothetical protein D0861_06834 [Hortaea werneckii]
MNRSGVLFALAAYIGVTSATILQNGQVRPTDYPNTAIPAISGYNSTWCTYPPSADELSYKGRWDDKHISWWSAPGLKFGFQADYLAISFGNYTSEGVLIAYRLDGLDWTLTNVTTSSTHLLISPETTGFNLTTSGNGTSGNLTEAYRTFEMRVTNWAYGVQIQNVHVAGGAGRLVRIPEYTRRMELIGDSLSAGQYATLEGISSYSWGLMYGLGNTEFSVTAYPGICLHDSQCYGNVHGQELQWLKVPDTSYRAYQIYGEDPDNIPNWNFTAHPAADITVINLGTNDHNPTNNITAQEFRTGYINLITSILSRWPSTQIIVVSLWIGFTQVGSSYTEDGGLDAELQHVVRHFNNGSLNTRGECEACSVYYFNSTGILQHNDLGPLYHPTDVGHVKLASHLMMYVKLVFGWELEQTGPEVQHETLYWNDQTSY